MDSTNGYLDEWQPRGSASAVNADVPDIEAILIEEDDTRGTSPGNQGHGEIGIIGVPAAISNAIHHATGKRLLSLPMKIEDLF